MVIARSTLFVFCCSLRVRIVDLVDFTHNIGNIDMCTDLYVLFLGCGLCGGSMSRCDHFIWWAEGITYKFYGSSLQQPSQVTALTVGDY